MNNSSADAVTLVKEIKDEIGHCIDVTVLVCPPYTSLESVAGVIEGSNIQLGAQNMHHQPGGAFTGEISAGMLRHLFCSYVILGHSERRALFGESDGFINKKLLDETSSETSQMIAAILFNVIAPTLSLDLTLV